MEEDYRIMVKLKELLESVPREQVIQLDIWDKDDTIFIGTIHELKDYHIEIPMKYDDYDLAQVTAKFHGDRGAVLHILMYDYLGHKEVVS